MFLRQKRLMISFTSKDFCGYFNFKYFFYKLELTPSSIIHKGYNLYSKRSSQQVNCITVIFIDLNFQIQ